MDFDFDELRKDVLVINVDGELNGETSGELIEQLQQLIDTGIKRIVVDCTLLEYISSSGLATLTRLHKRMAQAGGDVKICSVKGVVGDLFRLMRFDAIFDIHPNIESARDAFEK